MFLTYSVAGVILPSMTTKYVAKAMMVSSANTLDMALTFLKTKARKAHIFTIDLCSSSYDLHDILSYFFNAK